MYFAVISNLVMEKCGLFPIYDLWALNLRIIRADVASTTSYEMPLGGEDEKNIEN